MYRTVYLWLTLFILIVLLQSCNKSTKITDEYTILYDNGCYEIHYTEINKRCCYINCIDGECPEEFHIPDETPEGLPIIGIFSNATIKGALLNVKKLYLSDTIKYLYDYALQNTSPEYLYIGDSVETMDGFSFDSICYNLSTVETHNNPYYDTPQNRCLVTSDVESLILGGIDGYIPLNIKVIGDCAFQCSPIENITLGDNITTIGCNAFSYTKNLNIDFVLPDSIVEIGIGAFRDSNITGLTGGSYTKIPQYMLAYCTSLKNFQIPDTVKEIESFFMSTTVCSGNEEPQLSLKELFIPASVEIIHKYAIPENITIYCEAEEQPEGWEENWANESNTIYWGQKRRE